jgi:hypothetical protein
MSRRTRTADLALALLATAPAPGIAEAGLRWLSPPHSGYYVLVPGTDRAIEASPDLMPGVSVRPGTV